MKTWSANSAKCKNCGTTRRKHEAKGYCSKCYPLFRRIEQSQMWDLNNPASLKGYPSAPILREPRVFPDVKEGMLKQWKRRLEWFRYREQKLTGGITGIDLEYPLCRIARMAGAKTDELFRGYAAVLDEELGPEERRFLFRLLDMIEQDVPWKGIDWNEVFMGERFRRNGP